MLYNHAVDLHPKGSNYFPENFQFHCNILYRLLQNMFFQMVRLW